MLKNNLINFLNENQYDYLLINSTNEFLVEYNELEQNARYYLTGFCGSTGDALLSKNGELYLFVDGRYHEQADKEVFENVTVIKLSLGESFLSNFISKIIPNSKLAITSNKISLSFYKSLKEELSKKNVEIISLQNDPIFNYIERKPFKNAKIIDIPLSITGKTSKDKLNDIQKNLLENEARLVTNLEQIAWILNKRCFAQNFSSSFKAKLLIEKDTYKLFYANELQQYYKFLENTTKTILYSPKYLSLGDYLLIKDHSKELSIDTIEMAKAIKTEAEIAHLQSCFKRTDIVVSKVRELINNTKSLTEQELVKFVEEEFFAQGATSLSFNTILASGKNSALAHYCTDMNQKTPIKNGDLVLLDCGAYFEGGYSTDITRVFCFGQPTEEAKQLYTTVLKANLNTYHINTKKNITGFELDCTARQIINKFKLEGYNFNHATGHGVGISVHEFPPSISASDLAKTPLENGMVFTIEPGLYNPNFGGVRLENTVFLKDGKIISFSKMRFEENLIDRKMLNKQETLWLNEWQTKAI